jgi:flavin-dependent dehydrogenase
MVQVAVDQGPAAGENGNGKGNGSGQELLSYWINVLSAHGVLKTGGAPIDVSAAVSMELPLAGALSQEGVANRTLLIGPAGGFYTACDEDIYPNCWSAVCAVEVIKKALKERHMQDALQAYRDAWGATLGDYLRGPQQNLRFLLPLVYRNGMMTARLTEAILLGRSVVR